METTGGFDRKSEIAGGFDRKSETTGGFDRKSEIAGGSDRKSENLLVDPIENLKIVSNRTHLTQEHVDRAFKEKSEILSSLLAQKTSVKLVSSHVIKAEGKQRTRAGCNSSAEDQAEVEDKAEQAEWLQIWGMHPRKSEKVTSNRRVV